MVDRGLWNPLRTLSSSPGEVRPLPTAGGASGWVSWPGLVVAESRRCRGLCSGLCGACGDVRVRKDCLQLVRFLSESEGVAAMGNVGCDM